MRSHKTLLVAATITVAAATSPLAAASDGSEGGEVGRYIVVLKPGTASNAVAAEHARTHGARIGFVYQHALKGYSAVMPKGRLAALRADDRVAYVERDGVVTAAAQTLPWGIDKIDADISSTRAGDGSGAVTNVSVYVLDTGVDAKHADLTVARHVNFAGGPNRDCNGHGTHVAGTIAAKDNGSDVVGVAPGAPITGVKVLSCSGSGTVSGVVKGIDWVTTNATGPAIANMSLGGGASQAIDDAVRSSVGSGVFYSVAAGNEGADACSSSPARAGAGVNNGIMTVAATDSADRESSWSNYGSCVDIWAPGVGVLSTKLNGGTSTKSGTSMAAPHGGGGGALLLSGQPSAGPTAVEVALTGAAQKTGTTSKSLAAVNRLYVGGF